MRLTCAFECYADQDLVLFLREECNLALDARHSFGQGEVINDLLKKAVADFGIVDEDPNSSHHPLRDQMRVVWKTDNLELRERSGRHLIIVKPELEDCFLAGVRRVKLESTLPSKPKDLQRLLNIPGHLAHSVFRQELRDMHRAARERKVPTLVTDLEDAVRTFWR
jgi:hypothetical protein